MNFGWWNTPPCSRKAWRANPSICCFQAASPWCRLTAAGKSPTTDLKRRKTSVRAIVSALENAIIATLAEYGIASANDPDRPGVYVGARKIASLGLRIKNGSVYHGLALNVNMDLEPFHQINPCGYAGLEMAQIADFVQPCPSWGEVAEKLAAHLVRELDDEKLKQ